MRSSVVRVLMVLPFVAAIAYGWRALGVSLDAIIFGSGSWGVGGVLKLALYQMVVRRLSHEGRSLRVVALVNGLVSGLTERTTLAPLSREGLARRFCSSHS